MAYRVSVARKVQKQIVRLPPAVRERVEAVFLDLAEEPRPTNSKKLTDRGDQWRLRIGQHRIIYEIDDAAQTILILEVWHRQHGYR